MVGYEANDRLSEILTRAHSHIGRRTPVAGSPHMLERELRHRRKLYLGSHVPLFGLLEKDDVVYDEDIETLSHYLAEQTLLFWMHKDEEARKFCYHFYHLSLFALLSGAIQECADDIIQLSESLVRSKTAVRIVLEDLLPPNLFSELYHFLYETNEDYFTVHFSDSVFYAVAAFLGALATRGETSTTQESEGPKDE